MAWSPDPSGTHLGQPYQDLGADFYTRRESPEQRRAYLLRQLEKLSPGCTITITPAEAA